MKLRTKLLINFTILFFILFNIFGFTLITVIFYNSLHNTVESSFDEYNIIYSNLQSGKSMSRQFYSIQDIITLKNNTYLRNTNSELIDLLVLNKEKEEIYASSDYIIVPDALYEELEEDKVNYVVIKEALGHVLLISKKVEFDNNSYYLVYKRQVEKIYTDRKQYVFMLMVFDLIGGIILIMIIYFFTRTITQPLQMLVENTKQLIQKNYEVELEEAGDIIEIHMLTDSFNTMSRAIFSHMNALEEENEKKQRFIDSLTHEIRTPLTSIIGYSSLCMQKKELSDSMILQSFDNIYKNGKRIEKLTENLIYLITLDKEKLNLKRVSIYKILTEIKVTYQIRLKEENIKLILPKKDLKVEGDEDLLIIMFSNFIDNAIKSVSGQDKKEIIIQIMENEVLICDSGKGIEEEELLKIFEPFYMADKSRKRDFDGFGLGLAICTKIMKLLDIQFQVESEVGKGTKILLKFRGIVL